MTTVTHIRTQSRAKAERLAMKACAMMHEDFATVTGPGQLRRFVYSRKILCWVLRKETALSLTAIGGILGRPDHATTAHHIKTVAATPALLSRAEMLRQQVTAQ